MIEKTEKDERRERARRQHNGCQQCGGMYTTDEVDGSKCAGLPGITCKICRQCGRATAKTTRHKKERL